MNKLLLFTTFLFVTIHLNAQNYSFNFNSTGRRVCLVSSKVNLTNEHVKIIFHDSLLNSNEPLFVNRRLLGTTSWNNVATHIPAGTGHWIDTNVNLGEVWEYQIKRQNTWTFAGNNYDATGYTIGTLLTDNSEYKGQMILLVADNIPTNLSVKYNRLKSELTNDGWFVNELIVARATNWDSGIDVVTIKNQIQTLYNNAPFNDKPKTLFILGHVPLPRCGSTEVVAPDDHSQNKGARGCDGYYADIDGVYTDTATYNPGGLSSSLAINLPNDFKWDQDFFPSDIEMAFGRIDFADLTDISTPEITLLENYLDRLSNYKNVRNGFYMGENSAFYFGYNNSNDGSYRSLINISKSENVFEKTDNSIPNEWVQNNGPFKIYMQNVTTPSINDWQIYGMNATVYSSDQSYWGFGDVPQPSGVYSRIRALLGVESKCLIALWTTTGLNIFHQACTGKTIGQAMKTIINHNETNQYLEKPQQQYDTQEWWNRTHFEIWGDPTISLFQVKPISNLSTNNVNGNAVLQWTASTDNDIVGYHIYESNSEIGMYQRISNLIVTDTNFQIPNYNGLNWYMVKAIKMIESGCGKFLHPSLGISIQDDLELSTNTTEIDSFLTLYPNPTHNNVHLKSESKITEIRVFNTIGQMILLETLSNYTYTMNINNWQNGIYLFEIIDERGFTSKKKIIKNN
ncbi:T9SS type A sorting domain-containing protein [Flavobacterium sp.]|uniref:T9SS type A sorting domain-containing protein n=1 Tax=Flavobacterium sp. TaxID=239 RepID=UPI0040487783